MSDAPDATPPGRGLGPVDPSAGERRRFERWAAQGGRVGVYGALVNQRGVINANSAVRGENGKIVRYAHLSTGNYNPGTARLYTDISHLTADKQITSDVDHVFVHIW